LCIGYEILLLSVEFPQKISAFDMIEMDVSIISSIFKASVLVSDVMSAMRVKDA
jgi:hypothetical protein